MMGSWFQLGRATEMETLVAQIRFSIKEVLNLRVLRALTQ